MERELENAFVAAVRLNRHRLYRVALSILRSPADAEDAVSTATEQTWKALPRIQDADRWRITRIPWPHRKPAHPSGNMFPG